VFRFRFLQISLFLTGCHYYSPLHPRCKLFALQIGLFHPENSPILDESDTSFILEILKSLIDKNQITRNLNQKRVSDRKCGDNLSNAIQNTDCGNSNNGNSNNGNDVLKLRCKMSVRERKIALVPAEFCRFSSEISRNEALNVSCEIFKKMKIDEKDLLENLKKITSLPSCKKISTISLDSFLNIVLGTWEIVRKKWNTHLRYLFFENCFCFRVVQELRFSDDNGEEESDSVLNEICRKSSRNSVKRPLRHFENLLSSYIDDDSNMISGENLMKKIHDESNRKNRKKYYEENFLLNKKKLNFNMSDKSIVEGEGEERDEEREYCIDMKEIGFIINCRKEESNVSLVSVDIKDVKNLKKGFVCELLTKKAFQNILFLINPDLSEEKVKS
jgi:hypothetical protein